MPRDLRHARLPLQALAAQRFSGLELILVMGATARAQLDDFQHWLEPLSVRLLDMAPGQTAAEGWAAGIHQAGADYVVMLEDHSWPEPGWAEALWKASLSGASALGPSIANGNPQLPLSWADYACGMARYAYPQAGQAGHTPSHNSCYRRADLLELFRADLATAISDEAGLQAELRRHRRVLEMVPAARVRHVNHSRWLPFLWHKLLGGCLYGGRRCALWSWPRRLVYTLGSPLIPLVRLAQWLPRWRSWPQPQERLRLGAALLHIMAGFTVHSLGECLGYLSRGWGAGRFYRWYSQIELNRWRHVHPSDLSLLEGNACATPS